MRWKEPFLQVCPITQIIQSERCPPSSFCPVEVPLLNTWTSEVVHDLLNPLPPCGACNEWLLKIQEQSPSFYVVTYQAIAGDSWGRGRKVCRKNSQTCSAEKGGQKGFHGFNGCLNMLFQGWPDLAAPMAEPGGKGELEPRRCSCPTLLCGSVEAKFAV